MELQYIERLNHLNYNYWKVMVRAYLESEDLWQAVERRDPSTNTLHKERRAKFIVLCLIEPSIVREIPEDLTTARDIWVHCSQRFYKRKVIMRAPPSPVPTRTSPSPSPPIPLTTVSPPSPAPRVSSPRATTSRSALTPSPPRNALL